MKYIHTPRVDARYWTAITLASVFGTNLGDLYAHESGLGIVKGLAVLALLTAGVFGPVMEDICEHAKGEGVVSIELTALLLGVLLAGRGRAAQIIAIYWTTVAVA